MRREYRQNIPMPGHFRAFSWRQNVTNHPNRNVSHTDASNPTPEAILQAREAAGLSQSEAGALIYSGLRSWQHWEWGTRRMHPGLFELFLIKSSKLAAQGKT
jgi:DNA-binding transcriptional regulator YiaG